MPHAGRVLCGIDMKRESAPDLNGPARFLGSCYNQSAMMSGNAVGLTPCSTRRVISSSIQTALVVIPGIAAVSPDSSEIRTP